MCLSVCLSVRQSDLFTLSKFFFWFNLSFLNINLTHVFTFIFFYLDLFSNYKKLVPICFLLKSFMDIVSP